MGNDPYYRLEGEDYGLNTTTTTSSSTSSIDNSNLESMSVVYKYGIGIISP